MTRTGLALLLLGFGALHSATASRTSIRLELGGDPSGCITIGSCSYGCGKLSTDAQPNVLTPLCAADKIPKKQPLRISIRGTEKKPYVLDEDTSKKYKCRHNKKNPDPKQFNCSDKKKKKKNDKDAAVSTAPKDKVAPTEAAPLENATTKEQPIVSGAEPNAEAATDPVDETPTEVDESLDTGADVAQANDASSPPSDIEAIASSVVEEAVLKAAGAPVPSTSEVSPTVTSPVEAASKSAVETSEVKPVVDSSTDVDAIVSHAVEEAIAKPTPVAEEASSVVEEPTSIVEEPSSVVEEPSPVVKIASPVAEETSSAAEETPSVAEETSPVVEEPSSVVEEPLPVAEETSSVAEKTSSVVEEPLSVVEEPSPIAEETSSVVEEPLPVAEETSSVVEEPLPVAEETSSVVEEPLPVAEETSSASPESSLLAEEESSAETSVAEPSPSETIPAESIYEAMSATVESIETTPSEAKEEVKTEEITSAQTELPVSNPSANVVPTSVIEEIKAAAHGDKPSAKPSPYKPLGPKTTKSESSSSATETSAVESEESSSSSEESASSTEESTSSTEESASSTEESASSTEESTSSTAESTSSTAESTSSTAESSSSTEEFTSSTAESTSSTEESTSSTAESTSSTVESTSSTAKPTSSKAKPTSSTAKPTSSKAKPTSSARKVQSSSSKAKSQSTKAPPANKNGKAKPAKQTVPVTTLGVPAAKTKSSATASSVASEKVEPTIDVDGTIPFFCEFVPSITGKNTGLGNLNVCCEEDTDCHGSCIDGACDKEFNVPTQTLNAKKPFPTIQCSKKTSIFGTEEGLGNLGDCCKTNNDCHGSCIKGACDAEDNVKLPSCTDNAYKGRLNGKGPEGVCCSSEADCLESCEAGVCTAPLSA